VIAEPFQQTATRHGLDWNSAFDPNTTFDNFEIRGTLPAPPGMPAVPSPVNTATGVVTNPTLTWTASTATSYDIAFGNSTPPPLLAPGLASPNYTPGQLLPNTRYFWQITARNASGSTAGPVWSFTTGSVSSDLLVSDTFTGSTSTLLPAHVADVNITGAPWTVTGGTPTPRLTNNTLGITAGSGHLQATVDVGLADVRVATNVKVPNGNFLAALAFRLVDANNHLLLVAYGDSVQLYRKQAGVYTLLASQTVGTIVAGTTHRLEVRATGSTIEAWWDNVQRFTIVDTFQQTATRHGLDWNSAFDANTTYDDFEIRRLP
jgi:hypothetical protein